MSRPGEPCGGRGEPDQVAAAVCWRTHPKHGIELLLVRTTGGNRWTFPKGHIKRREQAKPHRAAKREAKEEAGVRGKIEKQPFAHYLYEGGSDEELKTVLCVPAYLLRVEREKPPEEPHRTPTWFMPAEAQRHLAERREPEYADEAARVVEAATRRLAASQAG